MAEPLDACWDYQDPAGSEARLRAWQVAQPSGSPEAAEARTQVARALVLQRRFAEGHAELDCVEPCLANLPDRVRARYHLERGRTWRDEGATARAIEAFREALTAADRAVDDRLAVDAIHMLAVSVPPAEAETWVQRGVERAAASVERAVRGWGYTLANNHAHRLLDAGQAQAALPWLQRAATVATEFERQDLRRSVDCGRARALRLLGQIDESENLAQATLAAAEPGERVIGFLHEELAELCLARGECEGARPHLQAAVDLHSADPWFGPTEQPRLDRLRALLLRDDS